MATASIQIIAKQNTTSPCMGLEADKDGQPKSMEDVICRTCKDTVTAKGSNTSNLYSHLRSHHPTIYSKVMARKSTIKSKLSCSGVQPTITSVIEKSKLYDKHGKKWNEMTNAVTRYICKDMLPVYSVEKEGFHNMLKTLNPQYELPGQKEIPIPKLYAETRSKVANELEKVDYLLATTDLWLSSTCQPYMLYTVHFIDDKWIIQSRCLQALYLPEDHTTNILAEALTMTLENCNLDPTKQVSGLLL